ncbi:Vesicle transport protein SEC20 [Psilocybe cubensis]|uniref:Sec20 C-terminal domain-containing protein n=2 Tax=Psilocybe cubensis TaxID=181762 RepID=A0A8H7Y715_PSICU|nr:Vesicle transport protein SEC20 [Psilocybe cubensis]KAH9486206.1 Vesicle transport protein SEC20 [Psilocybe cubensis]
MAPIPKFPEEVESLISAIERRYKHIVDVEVPNLRQCVGPASVQQSLAEDVREDTVALTRQIESLALMVDDQKGAKTRKELKEIADDFQKKLESLRSESRAALLASKKAMDQRSKSNREELLSFSSAMTEKQNSSEKTTEDALMKANSDVTDALRRTIALMQTELERSVLTTQMLDESTRTLNSTSTQHDTLNNLMYTSRQLVTALEKSDWLDRILILSGLAFFVLVVLFILKQRIVDRGIRIAFWWTRFIPSFGDDAELLRAAEKGAASVVVEASSSISSVAASLASSVIPVASSILASMPSVVPVSPVLSESSSSSVSLISQAEPTPAETPVVDEAEVPTIDVEATVPSPEPEAVPDAAVHIEL